MKSKIYLSVNDVGYFSSDVFAAISICLGEVGTAKVGLEFETVQFVPAAFSESMATSVEQHKSARERYIRVAAIDIVMSEGIKNIISNALFRSKQMNTTGRSTTEVERKSQMKPSFQSRLPRARLLALRWCMRSKPTSMITNRKKSVMNMEMMVAMFTSTSGILHVPEAGAAAQEEWIPRTPCMRNRMLTPHTMVAAAMIPLFLFQMTMARSANSSAEEAKVTAAKIALRTTQTPEP